MTASPTSPQQRKVQIYTGNGKGKSTAAYGLALRAAGAGLKTLIIQFMKSTHPYSELHSLACLEEWISIERFGNDDFVLEKRPPTGEERRPGKDALQRTLDEFTRGQYDMIILDEACVAAYFGLLDPADMLPIFEARPASVELVLTGRYCPDNWLPFADLVTDMVEVKHYYTDGVLSRPGFDS